MISEYEFGRTGHLSSRVILGGVALAQVSQAEADAALELAFSYGVNHVDTAASYGQAEVRIGDWIKHQGKPFFLSTKTTERTAVKAREEIHRSLERLGVDRVDLLQLHNLVDAQEWEIALGPGGALEAAIEARQEGLVRFIGVTGHGLSVAVMHCRSLERFDFDSVLLPLNYALSRNERYMSEFATLESLCRARNVAVQTIKSTARSLWGDHPRIRATWYRPLEGQADIDTAVSWVLGHPGVFLNMVGDIHLQPRVLEAANRFESAPSEDEMQAWMIRSEIKPIFE